MMDKLLSIENEQIIILREILSNLSLEEQSLLQAKPVHRDELLKERVALRKKARALRVEKENLLKRMFQTLGVLDFEAEYDAILSIYPTTDMEVISELKHLEWQRQILSEKSLIQLKLNKGLKELIKHHPFSNYPTKAPAPKPSVTKKTQVL